MEQIHDVAIAGGGPAGASCATLCAVAGLKTVVLEKARFPRDKVCGDCVNPGCWGVLEELGVAGKVLGAAHARIAEVALVGMDGRRVGFELSGVRCGEIGVTRRVLDEILLRRSAEAGAEVCEEVTIRGLSRDAAGVWRVLAEDRVYRARRLVAADGRNSTVARLLGVAPAARRDRVGLQTHIATNGGTVRGIELHLMPEGYCGVAPVGEGLTNYCMVAAAGRLEGLKGAVSERFGLGPARVWRAIAPLERAPVGPLLDGVVYVGDAARVVEPFTGEGIYYALQSGRLAAECIIGARVERYPALHAALYRRRLWINGLARWAVTHPRSGEALLQVMSACPALPRYLVGRVIGAGYAAGSGRADDIQNMDQPAC